MIFKQTHNTRRLWEICQRKRIQELLLFQIWLHHGHHFVILELVHPPTHKANVRIKAINHESNHLRHIEGIGVQKWVRQFLVNIELPVHSRRLFLHKKKRVQSLEVKPHGQEQQKVVERHVPDDIHRMGPKVDVLVDVEKRREEVVHFRNRLRLVFVDHILRVHVERRGRVSFISFLNSRDSSVSLIKVPDYISEPILNRLLV